MHILIVDDHDLFRQNLVKLLQSELHVKTAIEADTVGSAHQLIAQHHQSLDLVLLDHDLPDGKGIDMLDGIRSEYPHLKVVILSGWEDPKLMQESLALGALGFIPKSIATSVLLTAIQLTLAGGTYIPTNLLPYLPKDGLNKSATVLEANNLTHRKLEVLALMREGLSNKQIARHLNISDATVKAHVTAILRIKGVSSRTQLISKVTD